MTVKPDEMYTLTLSGEEVLELRRCVKDRQIMVAADRSEGRYNDERYAETMHLLRSLETALQVRTPT